MTDTLTPEQIGELEALLTKASPGTWEVQDGNSWRRIGVRGEQDGGVICPIKQRDGHPDLHARREDLDLVCLLKNAAPALIAMAKRFSDWEGAFSDEIERHNLTISELQKAEAEVALVKEANEDLTAAYLAGYRKREVEVKSILARLKSAEAALDRAMARSNNWREEAAKLQAQMLADKGGHIAEEEAETPRTCEMSRLSLFSLSITVVVLCAALILGKRNTDSDAALAYSCGYLARTALDSSVSLSEDDFCRTYRLSAIAHGFSPAWDAYPEGQKP